MRPVRSLVSALLCLLLVLPAAAATVDGFYEGVVAGDGAPAGRPAAAIEALRQVVVRLTGQRSAGTDGALAALYSEAPRLAQSYRAVPPGQVGVAFDGAVLEARLAALGQRLWPRERPVTLVVLVNDRAGAAAGIAGAADADLRRELERAAAARGLPVVFASGLDAPAQAARFGDAAAARLEPLRALARQFGAQGVLVGRVSSAGLLWAWTGPAGTGSFNGAGADAIQALADRYGTQFAAAADRASGLVRVTVRGVVDLAGYAAVTQAFAGLGMVREVSAETAAADLLTLRVGFTGDPAALREAVLSSGRLMADPAAGGDGLRLVLRP